MNLANEGLEARRKEEEALAKNPTYRTPTVGELAQRLGNAYGLDGEYGTWAKTPQQALEETIQSLLPKLMQANVMPAAEY